MTEHRTAATTDDRGKVDAGAPNGDDLPDEDLSFASRLFCGEIHHRRVMPFPRMSDRERGQVERLTTAVVDYCDQNYDPQQVERDRWIPDSTLADLGEIGVLGLYADPDLGGQGLSQTGYCKVFQAIGQIDPTLAVVLGVHQSIGYKGIHLFGTKEQKQRFLPELTAGRKLAAYALTEPNAGSDAFHVLSTATPQHDGSYLLEGEKRYIGNGSRADVITTFARTPAGAHVAMLVESDMDGFEVGERYETMGLRGNDLRKLRFRGVRVPAANVLGEEGDGFRIAMEILNNGRMSLGAGSAGSVRLLLDHAITHVQEREQFGRPLADFELVAQKIGQMSSHLYGLESMAYLTTGMVDRGATDVSVESAMVKIAGTEFMWYAANRVFQLLGGKAYMTSEPYEKILRDIRVFPIFEGANDVLRLMVALQGCRALGDELDDLVHLDLSDPLRSVGAVAGYVGTRVGLAVSPPSLEVGDAFAEASDRVGKQVAGLRGATEQLLREHGKQITDQQAQLKRLAQTAMEIYAQTANLSRISEVRDETSDSTALGEEEAIASSFCRRSATRSNRWLARIDHNDDAQVADVAEAILGRGRYTHSI